MAEFINTIAALGDDAVVDSLIERTITEFKDNSITSLRYAAFKGCAALTLVDLPKITYYDPQSLADCSALKALILRGETVCTNPNGDVLGGSGIQLKTGYVYVPRALVDSYKAATNWSTHATQIRALEDYTVDGTITGELDESKI